MVVVLLHRPEQNQLFAAFPADVRSRLNPHLEYMMQPLGHRVYDFGDDPQYVCFPTESIVALVHIMKNGASAEIAMVGCDGMVGVTQFMGGGAMSNHAVVVSAGHAFRLKASLLKEEFNRCGALQHILLRYTQALLTQMAQTGACNRHHCLEQQLCRWLLLCVDRAPSNDLAMTHELIASMLGVRREGVTGAASKLQACGLIRYHRGHIMILDRAGLEKRVCECYAVVRNECNRLLPEFGASAMPIEACA